jgi:adenosylmethionine-8-amino-7-oxononanoate aminotransferase
MNIQANERPASHLFYVTRLRRPLVDRAEGIYFWTQDGRRFIDGSSGPMVSNIGHGNRHVIDAMKRQMEKRQFRLPPAFRKRTGRGAGPTLAGKMPGDLDRIFFVSGGSEAVESAIKLARQWAVATTGQPKRWKVICRFPSYHGGTIGALGVTGDLALTETFAPQIQPMPSHSGSNSLPRPRQPDDGTARPALCRYAGREDPIRRAGKRRRLHHGADRRRGDRRAGGAGQLFRAHPRNLRQIRHPADP